MTTDPDETAGKDSGSSDLPDSDPRNPRDLILIDGPHHRQTLRASLWDDPSPKVLLLSTNADGSPSAPFFAEYRPTDRRDAFTGLRIYTFIGIGIDGGSIKAAKVNPNPPAPIHPHPKATSYTKRYKK